MRKPLDGITVLDLGQIYQGPYCSLLLSYLGADVVKVEPPWGENVRTRTEDGIPPQYQFLNANKRSITLDFKDDSDRDAFLRVVEKADVLVENFSSGTMDSLGLGYSELKEVNPELIYGHGSGFGNDGPYSDYPAMDLTIQAMSGVIHTTGYPDGDPVKAGPAVCDFLGAVHLALGIVSALYERDITGEGQFVEVGMFDCMYPTLASPVSSWVSKSDAPPRTGNKHSGLAIAPYDVFEVADGYVAIICTSERHWESLATVMGREDMIGDKRFGSKYARAQHMDTITEVIKTWLNGMTKSEVVETLLDAEVPCAPVQTIEQIVDDPHLKEREMLNYFENRSFGRDEIPVPGMPIQFSDSDGPAIRPAPELGEHTDEILEELAEYSPDEIRQFMNNE